MEGVSPKQGWYFRAFFVLNKVRILDPQWHAYAQTQVKCPLPRENASKSLRKFKTPNVCLIFQLPTFG